MMDLNLPRRKREKAIAYGVASEFIEATKGAVSVPHELLAHHFALVCERLGYTPTAASTARIFNYTGAEIGRRDRVVTDLQRALDKVPAIVDGYRSVDT